MTLGCTAFPTWSDLRDAMKGGYSPSFRRNGKLPEEPGCILEMLGYRVNWIE